MRVSGYMENTPHTLTLRSEHSQTLSPMRFYTADTKITVRNDNNTETDESNNARNEQNAHSCISPTDKRCNELWLICLCNEKQCTFKKSVCRFSLNPNTLFLIQNNFTQTSYTYSTSTTATAIHYNLMVLFHYVNGYYYRYGVTMVKKTSLQRVQKKTEISNFYRLSQTHKHRKNQTITKPNERHRLKHTLNETELKLWWFGITVQWCHNTNSNNEKKKSKHSKRMQITTKLTQNILLSTNFTKTTQKQHEKKNS